MQLRLPIRMALSRVRPSCIDLGRSVLTPRTTVRGIKYGWSTAPPRSKHWRFNQVTSGLPAPTTGPAAALKRRENTTPHRTGVLATKMGMTGMFIGQRHVACTVLQMDQVQVVANKTRAQDGYWAVQVGHGSRSPRAVTSPLLGYYEAKGIAPKEGLHEFRVRTKAGLLPVGAPLRPDWFRVGQQVDVRARTRGMGFAGGMKLHGFKGQQASHGNSKNHRTIGSVGPSQGGGSRVHPGKKMPGRMGFDYATVQNLRVLRVDNELGLVVVSGPIPGPKGRVVQLQDAKKRLPPSEDFRNAAVARIREENPHLENDLRRAREMHLMRKEERQQHLNDLTG